MLILRYILSFLILLSFFYPSSSLVGQPRCRTGTDTFTFNRLAKGTTVNQDTWNVVSTKSSPACKYHMFSKTEMLTGLADQWIIYASGSSGMDVAGNWFTLFKPRTSAYPNADTDTWGDCSGCNLQKFSQVCNGCLVTWMDMVVAQNGTVLSFHINLSDNLEDNDSVCTPPCAANKGINDAGVANVKAWIQSHPQPTGAFRLTWARLRWYPGLYPFVAAVRPANPTRIPTLITNILVWYTFCNSGYTWCPRPKTYPSNGGAALNVLIPAEMNYMISDFTTKMPDFKLHLLENCQESISPAVNGYIDNVLNALTPAQKKIWNLFDNRNQVTVDPWSELTTVNTMIPNPAKGGSCCGSHPSNINSQFLIQRFCNFLIDSPFADSSYGENITLNDVGCTADTAPATNDQWNDILWHGCKYTIQSAGIQQELCSAITCPALQNNPTPSKKCQWSTCAVTECCVNNPTCSGYSCAAGYSLISNPSNKTCIGATCTSSECCQANPTCVSYSCPADNSLVSGYTTKVCAGATCTNSDCCVVNQKCSAYSCIAGTSPIVANSGDYCAAASCTNSECCFGLPRCDAWTCYGQTNPFTPSTDFNCATTSCVNADCCAGPADCVGYPYCTGATHVRTDASTTTCSTTNCDTATCCATNPYCSTYSCPTGNHLIANPGTKQCAGGTCTNAECCLANPTCAGYSCPANNSFVSGYASKVCAGATCANSDCCVVNQKCSAYSCASGTSLIVATSGNYCAAASCTNSECCFSLPICDSWTCYGGTAALTPAANYYCSSATCLNSDCCTGTPNCVGYPGCATGFHVRSDANTTNCTKDCTASMCCAKNPTCSGYLCPTGNHLITNPQNKQCVGGVCQNAECCLLSGICNTYLCLGQSIPLSNSSALLYCKDTTCTNPECCRNPTCENFGCDTGYELSASARFIQCQNPNCTNSECCVPIPVPNLLNPKPFDFTLAWALNGSKVDHKLFVAQDLDTFAATYVDAGPQTSIYVNKKLDWWHILLLVICLIFDLLMVVLELVPNKHIDKYYPWVNVLKSKVRGDAEAAWWDEEHIETRPRGFANRGKLFTIYMEYGPPAAPPPPPPPPPPKGGSGHHSDIPPPPPSEENILNMMDRLPEGGDIELEETSPTETNDDQSPGVEHKPLSSIPASSSSRINTPEHSKKGSPGSSGKNRTLDNSAKGGTTGGEPQQRKFGRVTALGFARFLASVHVVCGHLVRYAGPPVPNWPTSDWGFTWVPWFMMLSGYILTYARLSSRDPDKLEPISDFMSKRIRSVYPLYFVGLMITVAIGSQAAGATRVADQNPWYFLCSLFLIQAWIPQVPENVVQEQCWFLSCIIVFWFLHTWAYKWMRKWPTWALWAFLIGTSLAPWIGLVIVPAALGASFTWFSDHVVGSAATPLDIIVVMLKYHPFFYWQIYGFGMALALLLYDYNVKNKEYPFLFKYGASIGYPCLFIIFALSGFGKPPGSNLTCRLGMLAPLHGLILVGLSLDYDYITKFFGHRVFEGLEKLSFPQYVFQFIAFSIWAQYTGFGYWCVLWALMIVGYIFIQEPFGLPNEKDKTYWESNRREKTRGFIAMILLTVICWALFLANGGKNYNPVVKAKPTPIPAFLYYSPEAYDVRLNFTSQALFFGKFDEDQTKYINPSLLYFSSEDPTVPSWLSGKLLATARRHLYSRSTFGPRDAVVKIDGQYVTKSVVGGELIEWYSDMVLGFLDPITLELVSPMVMIPLSQVTQTGANQSWIACAQIPAYVPENNTVSQVYSNGPEDPRLFTFQNDTYVSFLSWPPTTDANGQCLERARMYHAKLPLDQLIGTSAPKPPTTLIPATEMVWKDIFIPDPLQNGTLVPKDIEKNWLNFNNPTSNYFIRNLYPFQVLEENVTGNMLNGNQTKISQSVYDLFDRSVNQEISLHGGANCILITPPTNTSLFTTMPFLDRPSYYLSAFHTVQTDDTGKYWNYLNYLLEFDTVPPYNILRVSDALPLLMAPPDPSTAFPLAFLSGLALTNDRLLVSYGSSNSESRILSLSRQGLELLFPDPVPK